MSPPPPPSVQKKMFRLLVEQVRLVWKKILVDEGKMVKWRQRLPSTEEGKSIFF